MTDYRYDNLRYFIAERVEQLKRQETKYKRSKNKKEQQWAKANYNFYIYSELESILLLDSHRNGG